MERRRSRRFGSLAVAFGVIAAVMALDHSGASESSSTQPDFNEMAVITSNGRVLAGQSRCSIVRPSTKNAIAADVGEDGAWLLDRDGNVTVVGETSWFGDLSTTELVGAPVDIEATPTGRGYWIAAADGGVFTFGDAPFFGSAASPKVKARAITSTTSGRGYWIVTATGAVLAFGDAQWKGDRRGKGALSISALDDGYVLRDKRGQLFGFGVDVTMLNGPKLVDVVDVNGLVELDVSGRAVQVAERSAVLNTRNEPTNVVEVGRASLLPGERAIALVPWDCPTPLPSSTSTAPTMTTTAQGAPVVIYLPSPMTSTTTTSSPTTTNVALNRPARMSSAYFSSDAQRGVDGHIPSVASEPATADGWLDVTFTTDIEAEPWWEVELGSLRTHQRIELFNRNDVVQFRAADVTVFLSDTAFSPTATYDSLLGDPAVRHFSVSGPWGRTATINVGSVQGRYVRLQLPCRPNGSGGCLVDRYLHLSEVQMLGY
jgi:hypothetical protein